MHHLNRAWPVLLLGLTFSACEVINPAEELPAYISFQNPVVEAPDDSTFTSNSGIRNLWLYHNGFLQGAYQLDPEVDTNGRVVPVLQLKDSDFFIDAGIYESGQSAFQIVYPFWDRVFFDWAAEVGDTLVLTPRFKYVDPDLYDMPLSVTFEGGGFDFDSFGSGFDVENTFITIQSSDVFRGTGSGRVDFSSGHRYFEVISSEPFHSVQAANIFAEITYKSNIPFSVGLIYGSNTSPNRLPILTVSPSGRWNSVYVHMITEVRGILNQLGQDTDLWLWIKADGENQDGYILFDDIRVIKEKS